MVNWRSLLAELRAEWSPSGQAKLDALARELEAMERVAETDAEVLRVRELTSADEPKPGTLPWQDLISEALTARDSARDAYRALKAERAS